MSKIKFINFDWIEDYVEETLWNKFISRFKSLKFEPKPITVFSDTIFYIENEDTMSILESFFNEFGITFEGADPEDISTYLEDIKEEEGSIDFNTEEIETKCDFEKCITLLIEKIKENDSFLLNLISKEFSRTEEIDVFCLFCDLGNLQVLESIQKHISTLQKYEKHMSEMLDMFINNSKES